MVSFQITSFWVVTSCSLIGGHRRFLIFRVDLQYVGSVFFQFVLNLFQTARCHIRENSNCGNRWTHVRKCNLLEIMCCWSGKLHGVRWVWGNGGMVTGSRKLKKFGEIPFALPFCPPRILQGHSWFTPKLRGDTKMPNQMSFTELEERLAQTLFRNERTIFYARFEAVIAVLLKL